MFGFRALCSPRLYALPRTPLHPTPIFPILQRFISASPLTEDQIQDDNVQKGKKPLLDLFKEAVGLREKPESESEGEDTELKKKLRELERDVRRLKSITVTERETLKKKNMKKEMKKDGVLELNSITVAESETPKKKELKKDEVLELNSNTVTESETPNRNKKKTKELKKDGVLEEQTNPTINRLSSLFLNGKNRDGIRRESGSLEKKKVTEEEEEPAVSKSGSLEKKKKKKETEEEDEPAVFKDLSEDMLLFLNHLHRKGYFKNANFLPRSGSIDGAFDDKYSRCFVKFAAEKFGRDNQEIAKWLSGSDLKKVALFGCPSLSRRSIFAAKRLRTFFRIQEELVCSNCVLKQSCKFVNQSVWKGDTKSLKLSVTMRLLTLYAMESTHPQLVLSDEVKASVSRLLKDVLRLSDTVA